jgi:hypothetical protein
MHATDHRNAAGRCESQWGSVKPLFYSCGYCCGTGSFQGSNVFIYSASLGSTVLLFLIILSVRSLWFTEKGML